MVLSHNKLSKMANALGIDFLKAILSHKLKDKILPTEFYRNRFQSEFSVVFNELIDLGYAEKIQFQDLWFYTITESGIAQFRKDFNEVANYKPSKLRDLEYLKTRINHYTKYYNYHFCYDNSQHIIDAYVNEYSKGYYVSHTTKDVIEIFKKELRHYHKKGLLV